jgi:hypothetical protein
MLEARRVWNDVFYAVKGNNCESKFPYPSKLSFTIEKEIKT